MNQPEPAPRPPARRPSSGPHTARAESPAPDHGARVPDSVVSGGRWPRPAELLPERPRILIGLLSAVLVLGAARSGYRLVGRGNRAATGRAAPATPPGS
ncbi:hypothetical protein ACH474_05360 [Nocardia rhamnosiphila]|uniref:hypothetical protein n=1 Tax=Nocardia rhamnosiphila TaxID=426716 RepID=UPI0033F0FCA7